MSSASSSSANSLFAITLCAIIQVSSQVVFQVIIAKNFGANADVDTFSAALAIPMVLVTIFTNSISYIMVPLLVPLYQDRQRSSEFQQVAFAIGIWAISFCTVVSLSVGLFAVPITQWLYPRFGGVQQEMASHMLRVLSPLVALSSIQGWLQGLYHSRQNFLIPAIASATGPSVVTLLLVAPVALETPIHWLAWCLVLGTIATLTVLAPGVRFGIPNRWLIHPSATLAIRRSIPLLAFNSYTKLDPVFDRVLLAGLTVGAIAHLNYAQRFVTALILIASSGVSTMAFSDLSGALSGDRSHFAARFFENLRRMILVITPVVIGLAIFAQPSIKTLLERGQFTSQDTSQVAMLLVALIGFFVASAIGDMLAKSFYAMGDTSTPSIIGAIAFSVGLLMKWIGVYHFGVMGLAIATSAYTLLSVLVMLPILSWRFKLRNYHQELSGTAIRAVIASFVGSLIAAVVLNIPLSSAWWLAVLLGGAAYVYLLNLLQEPTWKSMIQRK